VSRCAQPSSSRHSVGAEAKQGGSGSPCHFKTWDVRDFLAWSIHHGQKLAEKRHCVPLPEEIVKRIDKKLKLLEGSK
jgi:hypothetical protein